MKFSLKWLRDYCPTDAEPAWLADRLTSVGLEVESLSPAGDDVALEVEVVPIRADCLSVIGLAREVAFLTGKPLRLPPVVFKEVNSSRGQTVAVDVKAPELCPRYSARVVTGVKVGPSPPWLAERLEAAGVRALNNIVDITNFVNLEMGQPLHAFDLARLGGRALVIRMAAAGEKLVLLNGQEISLTPEDLVIADAEKPMALAGVMGGAAGEVSASTDAVVIESAYFNPVQIRRTARRHELSTESSYRFERGTDPHATLAAADRAAALMAELAGGAVMAPAVDVGGPPPPLPTVGLRPDRANMLLGTKLSGEAMADLLRRLYFGVDIDRRENLVVTVPAFRRDVTSEVDVVEEIGRAYGYENVAATLPGGRPPGPAHVPREEFERGVRGVLTAAGFDEVYTSSFTNPAQLAASGLDADSAAEVLNPMVSHFSHLRPALWPAMAEAAARNGHAGAPGVTLFEFGQVFHKRADGTVAEENHLAALATGEVEPRHWSRRPASADVYFVKGIVEALARRLRLDWEWQGASFRIGAARGLFLERTLAPFGPAYVVELDVSPLYEGGRPARYTPISRFPSVTRDLALIVGEEVPAGDVVAALRASSRLVRDVGVFDVFTGKAVAAGKKSLGVRLVYQAEDRTLTDEEVNAACGEAFNQVAATFGAQLRS